MPSRRSTWLPTSEKECAASASMAALCERSPATSFRTAIRRLPRRAATTATLDSATKRGSPGQARRRRSALLAGAALVAHDLPGGRHVAHVLGEEGHVDGV